VRLAKRIAPKPPKPAISLYLGRYHRSLGTTIQYEFLFVVFLLVQTQAGDVGASREIPTQYARFFRALGHRVRSYRMERKLTQEDMISYGFSVRHWQMVESGRPITLFTLLRICEAFDVAPEKLVEGLAHHLRKRKKG
jgi:DNA-binding Xre family transcriptional regulator